MSDAKVIKATVPSEFDRLCERIRIQIHSPANRSISVDDVERLIEIAARARKDLAEAHQEQREAARDGWIEGRYGEGGRRW